MKEKKPGAKDTQSPDTGKKPKIAPPEEAPATEKGGYKDAGLAEPTRFGDWEVKGRCSDF